MNDINQNSVASNCYRLLSACFYEPEKQLFLDQKVCDNLASQLKSFSHEAAGHALKMAEHLLKQSQHTLTVDYSALFLGPFELQAPPYGSIYLEKKREVMGTSTMKVLKLYQEAGLEVKETEPADHIAIELEFMSFLHQREAEDDRDNSTQETRSYRQLREKFFTSCFSPWIPSFCSAIVNATDNPFYRSLADCLNTFVGSSLNVSRAC